MQVRDDLLEGIPKWLDVLLTDDENGFGVDIEVVVADHVAKRFGLFPVDLAVLS